MCAIIVESFFILKDVGEVEILVLSVASPIMTQECMTSPTLMKLFKSAQAM